MPDFRGNHCPARGVGLTHVQDMARYPDGRCIHCEAPVTANPDAVARAVPIELDDITGVTGELADPRALYERPVARHEYGAAAREHQRLSIIEFRAYRKIKSARHADAARLMHRALAAERDDPVPDYFAD